MFVALQIVRLVTIVALLCVAAAIATPKNRLPLALRGLAKLLNSVPDASRVAGVGQPDAPTRVPRLKRFLAFLLVLLAILLAMI